MENWRFIEANSDYMVSDHGRILSFKGKSKLIISGLIISGGYEQAEIRQKGISARYLVHRLVAKAFIPNPKHLPQVNHLDGNKLNNHVSNLEWCDAYDNTMHAIRTGLRPLKPAFSAIPCAMTDESGKILQAYPSMNALVKGEQMSPKERYWLVLHLLHPEQLEQSALKKKRRSEKPHSEDLFLTAPDLFVLPDTSGLPVLPVTSDLLVQPDMSGLPVLPVKSDLLVQPDMSGLPVLPVTSDLLVLPDMSGLPPLPVTSDLRVPTDSSSCFSSPHPLASPFVPVHHSVTQHYYRRLSPEESAGFGFNTYVSPRLRKEVLQ